MGYTWGSGGREEGAETLSVPAGPGAAGPGAGGEGTAPRADQGNRVPGHLARAWARLAAAGRRGSGDAAGGAADTPAPRPGAPAPAARAAARAARAALRLVYPPACAACGAPAIDDFGLCPACWRGAGFLGGLVCDTCGIALPGTDPGEPVHCDDCLTLGRPWARGRAVMDYGETARRLVLALKHGDRLELARPMGDWMARAAAPILAPGMVVAPVPLHWLRLLARRSNQAALLSARIARATGLGHVPDLLIRVRRTASQDGRGREGRFANLAGAIRAHPRRLHRLAGQHVLLVDDVMTSGATLAAAAEACLGGGAAAVSVVAFARVGKGGT